MSLTVGKLVIDCVLASKWQQLMDRPIQPPDRLMSNKKISAASAWTWAAARKTCRTNKPKRKPAQAPLEAIGPSKPSGDFEASTQSITSFPTF